MPNDKSPGNDGLKEMTEFFETFWSEVKKNILRITLTKTNNY